MLMDSYIKVLIATLIALLLMIPGIHLAYGDEGKDYNLCPEGGCFGDYLKNEWKFDHFTEWERHDQMIFIANVMVITADALQTNDIYHRQESYHEKNEMIDWGVKKFGKNFIPVFFVGAAALDYVVTGTLKGKYRTAFGTANVAFRVNVVRKNAKIGLNFRF